jgi:hypothetical protein
MPFRYTANTFITISVNKFARENNIKEKEIDNIFKKFSNIIEKAEKVKLEIENLGFDITICEKIIERIKLRLEKMI